MPAGADLRILAAQLENRLRCQGQLESPLPLRFPLDLLPY